MNKSMNYRHYVDLVDEIIPSGMDRYAMGKSVYVKVDGATVIKISVVLDSHGEVDSFALTAINKNAGILDSYYLDTEEELADADLFVERYIEAFTIR